MVSALDQFMTFANFLAADAARTSMLTLATIPPRNVVSFHAVVVLLARADHGARAVML